MNVWDLQLFVVDMSRRKVYIDQVEHAILQDPVLTCSEPGQDPGLGRITRRRYPSTIW